MQKSSNRAKNILFLKRYPEVNRIFLSSILGLAFLFTTPDFGTLLRKIFWEPFFPQEKLMAASLELSKTSSTSLAETGETFTYTLRYRCASLTDDCLGTLITDPLPAEVEFVSLVGSGHTTNENYNAGSHTVTFTFVDPLTAGTTGQVQVRVRFPNGTTANNTLASNTATMSASNASSVTSTANVTASASAKPVFEKEFVNGGAAGSLTTYQLKFCNNQGASNDNGTLDLSSIVLTDTLPAGSTFVQLSAGNGATGSYDAASHSVTITGTGALSSGDCLWPRITISYPDPPFSVGTTITNTGYFAFTPVGESRVKTPDSYTHTLISPNPYAYTDKISSRTSVRPGGSGTYYIYSNVSGTEDINDFCIADTIPAGIEINRFSMGGWYYGGISGSQFIINVYYTTNLNGPTLVAGSPFEIWDPGTFISAENDLGLTPGGGEYITSINFCFGDVPAGFAAYNDIRLEYTVMSTASPGIVTNCAEMTTSSSGFTLDEDCADLEIVAPHPGSIPDPYKSFAGKTSTTFLDIGDTIAILLRIKNGYSAGMDLVEPEMFDLLPPELSYIPGTWVVPSWGNQSGAPMPIFTETPNYNGSGRTRLAWSWTGASSHSFAANTQFYIYLDAIVTDAAIGGSSSFANEVTIVGGNIYDCWGYDKVDEFDLDNNGNFTEILCTDSTHFNINSIVSLESEKLVKGQLDANWTKYPETGFTVPGGLADYQLVVRNQGNVQLDSVIVIDILPFVGDAGVIDLNSRYSRWRPNLVGAVSAPTGVTVYYSTEGNPCRSAEGIEPTGPAGCASAGWTTIPPSDISSVQSLKFDFGATVLNPGDSLKLEWPMRAPVNVMSTLGALADSITWNSFGYIGQRLDNSEYLLASEPVKVGISMNQATPGVIGDYVWIDTNQNGIQNGGEAGADGVRIEIYLDNGDGIADPSVDTYQNFTLTADGGYYLFPNLPSGDYFLVFYLPPTYNFTTANQGGNDGLDSDGTAGTFNGFEVAITPVTSVNNTDFDYDWDQGIFPSGNAAVGNFVWHDLNNNGIQDESSSEGVNGLTVHLYDNAAPSSIYASTTTANSSGGFPGFYLFDDLPPGNYFLEFALPSSTTFTSTGSTGSSDPTDSDANASTGRTEVISLAANTYDDAWDAGVLLSGTEDCSNNIDDDSDGLIDCEDPDCPGPAISRVDSSSPDNCPFLENGQIVITATGSNLAYSINNGSSYQNSNTFNGLSAGSYNIWVRNSASSCSVAYTGNPVVLSNSTCPDPCVSCPVPYNFNWFDGSTGNTWPIINGESSYTQNYTVNGSSGPIGVDLSLDNSDGQNIDFSNCGTAGNHFYTATCNDPNASADCDGDPGTYDGQFNYGCSYLTFGITSNTSSEVTVLTFDFEYPVRLCDLRISDIDFEGSGSSILGSWQDEIDLTADSLGVPIDLNVAAGSAVSILNNNSPNVNVLAGYDNTSGGNLSPNDIAGTISISTTQYITSLSVAYSNGPDDDGASDDHAIRLSSFVICPVIPEICGDTFDNDGDGQTDCADDDCITSPSINTSLNTACINESIAVSASDIGSGTTYNWDFGTGATPATASGIGPHNVSYTSCGSKTVSLTVLRNTCSITVDSIVTIIDNTDPVWDTNPTDLIMACESSANYADSIALWLSNNGNGSASDNCNSLLITNDYSGLVPACSATTNTSVQFTATDSCGNSTARSANIRILDNQAPEIAIVNDLTVNCEVVPSATTPSVSDSCDLSPALNYQEVAIYHPNANWKSTGSCTLLYGLTSGLYDDKGTPSTADDEMSFVLTVIGQNTSSGWSANIGGSAVSDSYYASLSIGPFLSGGPSYSFTITDNTSGSCQLNVNVEASDF